MATARKRMHTRFPVTRNGLDSVFGVVHLKDLLHGPDDWNNQTLEMLVKTADFVDPSIRQDLLLKTLKDRRAHLAIVQDSKKNILA